jgi:hypothetical protein
MLTRKVTVTAAAAAAYTINQSINHHHHHPFLLFGIPPDFSRCFSFFLLSGLNEL